MTRDVTRWWEQFISALNEARGYIYLRDEGCREVHFIPTIKDTETPELEGMLDGKKVLCEVKTIHISKAEATRRQKRCVGDIETSLGEGFFKKLSDDLRKAESQMKSYESKGDVRRIAFIVPNFDDSLAEYKAEYFAQIDSHLAANSMPDIDIVFYNQKTVFPRCITMQNAVVVNE